MSIILPERALPGPRCGTYTSSLGKLLNPLPPTHTRTHYQAPPHPVRAPPPSSLTQPTPPHSASPTCTPTHPPSTVSSQRAPSQPGPLTAPHCSINQSRRKASYAKRSLKTNQHTTPDEVESHKPMPADHMDTALLLGPKCKPYTHAAGT